MHAFETLWQEAKELFEVYRNTRGANIENIIIIILRWHTPFVFPIADFLEKVHTHHITKDETGNVFCLTN
jgi:hypothetical protein